MFEGLKGAIHKAITDPKVIEAGGAIVYKEEVGFGHTPYVLSKESPDRGSGFIKIIIADEESYSWLPLSRAAKDNQGYLSTLINGEIMETV